MKRFNPKLSKWTLLFMCGASLIAPGAVGCEWPQGGGLLSLQTAYPAPPADRALIYVADESNALTPLPFEAGQTPLAIERVATGDKRGYVELKGESAASSLKSNEPRFYLFVPDTPNVHPPFIVSLTRKRGNRRVTAMAQKGFKGFAIDSGEIIKPHYRVLGAADAGMLFMEIRPRDMLLPGEYAIIGTDLQRIATFRIGGATIQK